MNYGVTPIVTPISDAQATAAVAGLGIFLVGIWAFFITLMLIGLGLWIWALVDFFKREWPNQNDKTLWLVLLLVSFFTGLYLIMAIIYLVFGRKQGTLPNKK